MMMWVADAAINVPIKASPKTAIEKFAGRNNPHKKQPKNTPTVRDNSVKE